MSYRIAPAAKSDLSNIWAYLYQESGSDAVADGQVDALFQRFTLLSTHPHLGRSRDRDLGVGRRTHPVGKYLIIYRVIGTIVDILRVLHSARDIQAILGQE